MLGFLDRISAGLARATDWLVALAATAMITSLVLGVFSRYVLGAAYSWTDEAALGLFTWTMLLAATRAIRDGTHVKLDFLMQFLPTPLRLAWSRIVASLVLLFCVIFAWTGGLYVADTTGQVTAALRLPVAYTYVAAPVCGMLGAVHALVRLLIPIDPDDPVVEVIS